jgi:hypothetical protein
MKIIENILKVCSNFGKSLSRTLAQVSFLLYSKINENSIYRNSFYCQNCAYSRADDNSILCKYNFPKLFFMFKFYCALGGGFSLSPQFYIPGTL